MKINTNITYKEFKETDIFKSAVIIEFVNSKGTTLNDIYDKDLDNMIVVDYNYDSGWMEIILREEENKMEKMLYNAIILLFDESLEEYQSLDHPDFINKVCTEIGMTEKEYRKLMLEG